MQEIKYEHLSLHEYVQLIKKMITMLLQIVLTLAEHLSYLLNIEYAPPVI